MFELSVACKYLLPRWRQLSVSIISLVSILVIALVVWLIVVFFSVKDGLENSWVEKIIALTAPIRITPTEKYYQSYYYLSDSISSRSDYTLKTVGEKLAAAASDPYDPAVDEELPAHWPGKDLALNGEFKDPVKMAFQHTSGLPSIKNPRITDFETTIAHLRLRLLRGVGAVNHPSQQFLDQAAYLGSFDSDSSVLAKAIQPFSIDDLNNLFNMQAISSDNIKEESPETFHRLEIKQMQERLQHYFQAIEITALKTPAMGWRIPYKFLPKHGQFQVVAQYKDGSINRLIIPINAKDTAEMVQRYIALGIQSKAATLTIDQDILALEFDGEKSQALPPWMPLQLESHVELSASLVKDSIAKAAKPKALRFNIKANVQGNVIQGETALDRFEIAAAHAKTDHATPLFAALPKEGITLPHDAAVGDGILLPKSFRDAGVLLGDQGYLSYHSPTPSSVQEQRVPVFVAGFYDPGIIPIGGKYILAPKELIAMVRAAYDNNDALASNGLNLRFDNLGDAAKIKYELQQAFEKDGIAPYWNIQTYQEYEFTKDLIQQLHSEKNLFSVISLVIIIVACSNIISMLIILVNDKKLEIGILRSMGATSASIATIFGLCGMVMGTLGSVIGICAAVLTLRHINELVDLIGRLQGHDLFNPVFYGTSLPSELSLEALIFVVITTAFISLLAGIVPAVKASMLRPSAILRAE